MSTLSRSAADDLDWAMLDLRGAPATEVAKTRRRVMGGYVADRERARYAQRFYGRRWQRSRRAWLRRERARREARLVEALAAMLMGERPRDVDAARARVRAALAAARG
ncbi:MAG: hypothetical protein R3F65_20965 [bacterium]|nr:hypothetical protein [Myxococcales bacterium]MCB9542988.1 hypothetical protein [Myxococcales bacterium]MCB9551795.1 hypothetical protein [Myxococcales bacterium]